MSRFNKDHDAASTASHSDTVGSAQGTALYKYRDFSHVSVEVLEEDTRNESPLPPSANATETSIRIQKFPAKLYAILAQKEFSNIITWMPHGRSWKVLKPNMFESMIMPLFFEYSNYHSFNRLVNAWSFRRIRSGPDRGSYYHELFLRGTPHLQKYMRRLPKSHKKVPMKDHDEPDFRELDRVNPLPQLDESFAIGDTSLEPNHLRTHPQSTKNDNRSIGIGQGLGGVSAFEPLDPLIGAISQRRFSGSLSEVGMSFNAMNTMGSIGTMPSIYGRGSLNSMGGMGSSEGFSVFSDMNQMNTGSGVNAMLDSSPCGVDSGVATSSMGNIQLLRFEQFQQLQQLQSLDRQMRSSSGISATDQDNLLLANLFMGSQHC